MTPEAWAFATQAVVTAAGVAVVWLKLRRTRASVNHAAEVAEQARDYAEPTGNGFAAEVLKTLREIRGEVAEVRGGLGELRNDVRGNTGAIVGHLGDHARGGTGQLDRPAPPEDPSPGKRKRGRRRPR